MSLQTTHEKPHVEVIGERLKEMKGATLFVKRAKVSRPFLGVITLGDWRDYDPPLKVRVRDAQSVTYNLARRLYGTVLVADVLEPDRVDGYNDGQLAAVPGPDLDLQLQSTPSPLWVGDPRPPATPPARESEAVAQCKRLLRANDLLCLANMDDALKEVNDELDSLWDKLSEEERVEMGRFSSDLRKAWPVWERRCHAVAFLVTVRDNPLFSQERINYWTKERDEAEAEILAEVEKIRKGTA